MNCNILIIVFYKPGGMIPGMIVPNTFGSNKIPCILSPLKLNYLYMSVGGLPFISSNSLCYNSNFPNALTGV
ncbi:MAG: hypothetical protein IEMM0006_1305 [bacterium]|nr:MAG: hypothetical protein IEMM0006_1305 [bacterium]